MQMTRHQRLEAVPHWTLEAYHKMSLTKLLISGINVHAWRWKDVTLNVC